MWQVAANRLLCQALLFLSSVKSFARRVVFYMLSFCLRTCTCTRASHHVCLHVSCSGLLSTCVAFEPSSRLGFFSSRCHESLSCFTIAVVLPNISSHCSHFGHRLAIETSRPHHMCSHHVSSCFVARDLLCWFVLVAMRRKGLLFLVSKSLW